MGEDVGAVADEDVDMGAVQGVGMGEGEINNYKLWYRVDYRKGGTSVIRHIIAGPLVCQNSKVGIWRLMWLSQTGLQSDGVCPWDVSS